jgi:hypothetical protein
VVDTQTKTADGGPESQTPHPDAELQSAATYLRWIAADIKLMRQQFTELNRYIREAESEVPEKLRRFGNYFHDIHDIKFTYEEVGQKPPTHLLDELERLDDRYRQILKEMNSDGGVLEKVRREMASDPENRWDHTRQLQFKKSGL